MQNIYKKNELFFALIWIAVYVIGISTADGLSEEFGILKVITLPVALVLSFFLYGWIRKNKLQQYYGLRRITSIDFRKYLYFLPLLVLSTANFWNGAVFEHSFLETALFIVSMLFIGFLEEVIFRGFLFKALSRKSIRSATAHLQCHIRDGPYREPAERSGFSSDVAADRLRDRNRFPFYRIVHENKKLVAGHPCACVHQRNEPLCSGRKWIRPAHQQPRDGGSFSWLRAVSFADCS